MPIFPRDGATGAAGAAGAAGATGATGPAGGKPAGGRLTLETGVPISTTDQTAKVTIYYAIYKSAEISLYYGGAWTVRTFAELNSALPGVANAMHDVFVYWDGAACQIELLAWTNDTTRATALVRQDGVWVKSGATDRRYVGSFRTTGSAGQCEDSDLKRFVWNADNRVLRRSQLLLSNTSWTYASNTIRQWNASSANQVAFIVGLQEDFRTYNVNTVGLNSSGWIAVGVGLNSTTTFTGGVVMIITNSNGASAACSSVIIPALGYNYVAGLERCDGTYTGTNNGSGANGQSGIFGNVLA